MHLCHLTKVLSLHAVNELLVSAGLLLAPINRFERDAERFRQVCCLLTAQSQNVKSGTDEFSFMHGLSFKVWGPGVRV